MNKCTALEPAPTRFYAPIRLFTDEDLRQLSAEYLGEVIVCPGGSFRYRVTSGPLCRLYWERGKPQPNVNESAYFRNPSGRGWRRAHSNYLSYQVEGGSFVTVRWQAPGQQSNFCRSTSQVAAYTIFLNASHR
jgi:hypothetical protein